jgi:protein-S-isoprenylcysteine O-methyltransferase Ste14
VSDLSTMLIRLGHFFFRARDLVFPAVLLALAFGTKPLVLNGDWQLDRGLDLLGFAVALSGQLLRVAVIGFAYITRGGQNRRIYADSLVQEGIFAHSRNPLYLGNILIVAGLAIVHGSFWFYFLGIPFFVFAYLAIVCAEEDFLRHKFGSAYQDYCRRVNRFVPSMRGLRRTLEHLTFDWKKVVRKEYGTPFAWMSGMLAILVVERVVTPGAGLAPRTEVAICATWAVLAVAYLTARILKKRGALGTG